MTSVNTLPESVDTLVIGAGTGGAAFAGTLAENSDESVLVLDAGPDYGPLAGGQWPADMLDARWIPLSHDYDLKTQRTSGEGDLDLPRARIFGGCSAHNGCTASISSREDYDEWAAWGNTSWSADQVVPLLEEIREKFKVRRYTMDELTPPQKAFVEAGLAAGLPFADDLDDIAAAEGIGPMPVNIVDGVRYNAAFAFLDPVRDRPNLQIAGEIQAVRLEVEDGAVVGAWVRNWGDAAGSERLVKARRVVVAGGAYHSPALLLASGIGPADELRELDIDVVQDLPGVGKHLLDHETVQLDFAGYEGMAEELEALEWNPDEQSLGRAKSSVCDEGPYDIHVFMVAGANSGHPGLPPISLYGGAMRAKSEGEVRLSAKGDVTDPVIEHRYGSDLDGHDKQVLSEALELLERMVEQPVLAKVLGERVTTNVPEPMQDIVNYCHPAGTCKMGPSDDPTAVVGDDGQVHGVSGLYVADASIMPAITRGNINLPTAMIGAHIARRLESLA